jgi:hypothetical protein
MAYGMTAWTTATEITSTRMQEYTNSISWRHERLSYPFDLSGGLIEHSGGVGKVEGYLFVSPGTYPGYAGYGAPFGMLRLSFPPGLFEELLFVKCTIGTGSNYASSVTVLEEGPGGVNCFVWDQGGTPIAGFALWVTAIGKLKAGVLP